MLIAIPSESPGGLDAAISAHFGHCHAFTLVELTDGEVQGTRILPNVEHAHGGCLTPVNLLRDQGVEALVAGGMGARPLAGFQDVGIRVYFKGAASTVSDAVELIRSGEVQEFGPSQTCGGHGTCGHGHDQATEIERPDFEGTLDVQRGRVVGFTYTLFDAATDEQLDSSEARGPMSYLHGYGQIIPGLEKGMEGLELGEVATITVAPEDAYGQPDPRQIFQVPRDRLRADVTPGTRVQTATQRGMVMLTVVEVGEDEVTLDANHPMAGRTLRFEVEVVDLQLAAPEELAAGRVLI